MARREYDVLGKREGIQSHDKYTILSANLESRPNRYEMVVEQTGNEGYLSVFRDKITTVAIAVQGDGSGDDALLTLVGETSQLEKTLKELESIPSTLKFKPKKKK